MESVVATVARFVPLTANGSGFIGKCPLHNDEGKSLRVDEKSWCCLGCGGHDNGQGDVAGWLMAWSQCSRAEAEHQLSNGGLPEQIPIQVPPLKKLPFWGDWALHKYPDARVWIHDNNAGVEKGRDYFPERVHLGIITGAALDDVSQLTKRECILLPLNRESSFERMDRLAAALYAAGHLKVKYIDVSKQEDMWSWPGQLDKEQARAFAVAHAKPYPKPVNAAPHPASASPSSSLELDGGAASPPKRGNGQAGPIAPPERADAYLEATRKEVLSSLIYVRVSDVRLKRLNWLWPAKIPRGMITMLQGDPKLGKSQICASIASIVSNSGQWPVTRERCEGGSVIILSSEDPLQELLGPRLVAAGADISKVIVLQMIKDPAKGARGFDLGLDIARLGVLIDEIADVKLVIIDPISAYLGAVDSHKNAEVRGLLRPMEELIARKAVAMIFVNHLTKDTTKKAMMRGQMSIAFSAVARAVWGVVVDDEAPEDSRRRLFLPVGVNMARDQAGLAYTIEGAQLDSPDGGEPIETSRIMWEAGEVTANIDAVSARSGYSHDERGSIAEARDFLAETLAEGRLTAKEVERLAKLAGHNLTTLGRAKRAMGIKSEKEGWANQTVWYWRL